MAQSNRFVATHAVVPLFNPVDIDTVPTSDWLSFKGYGHVTILLVLGVTGAASNITLNQATSATGTSSKALSFTTAYRNITADGTSGLLSSFTVASSTFATSTNDGVVYAIELDAEDLDVNNSFTFFNIATSDPAAATFACALAIFTAPRYPSETLTDPTA